MTSLLSSPLLRRSLLEVVMVGALCGVVGVHVVLRRLPFFTLAMAHATFPGLVLAALLGVSLFGGALAFGAAVVVAVAALGTTEHVDETSATGVVLAGAFAVGVLLLSTKPGSSKDLAAYLVGSVLTVGPADLVTTAVAGSFVLLVLGVLHKEIVLGAFDPSAARALGYRAWLLDLVVLLAVEVTVVTSIPAVGTVLSVALVVTPAATARLWSERIGPTMALAAVFGAASGAIGLLVSERLRVAAGGSVVLVATAGFVLSLAVSARLGARAKRRLGARARRQVHA